jgi:hypothetical protein
LAQFLDQHEISTVPDMSWSGVKNGELLLLIEAAKFEVFLSADQNLQAQQNLARRPFAILIMTAVNWPIVRPHVAKIAAAVDSANPGTVATIECGRFIARKLRKPDGP